MLAAMVAILKITSTLESLHRRLIGINTAASTAVNTMTTFARADQRLILRRLLRTDMLVVKLR